MKHLFLAVLLAVSSTCLGQIIEEVQHDSAGSLLRICEEESYELGIPCGYINEMGDTVIPFGKYRYCYTDTFKTYAIVMPHGKNTIRPVAIDRKENILYEVYWFDNGPDWPEEGLFRIVKDGKIGYANLNGEVIIKPSFECAEQFKNGKARVAYQCKLIKAEDSEHTEMQSESWFYIDKSGRKVD